MNIYSITQNCQLLKTKLDLFANQIYNISGRNTDCRQRIIKKKKINKLAFQIGGKGCSKNKYRLKPFSIYSPLFIVSAFATDWFLNN